MTTFGIDLHLMNKTPPPQTFSPSRGDRHSQATSQRQYHNPFSEQAISPWQQNRLDDHNDGVISGFGLMQNTSLDNSSSASSLEWSSRYSTTDSYSSRNASYSLGSGSVDPGSMRGGNSPDYSYQVPLTGALPLDSPTALSPTSSDYQSGSPAQATVYTTHPPNDHFSHDPNLQYPVRQEQQPAIGPQIWGHYPNQNADNFVLSPRLPYQPTPHDEYQDIEADHPGPGPYLCDCGMKFGRLTDLERHRKTSKRHNKDPRGLACPMDPCSYRSRFTRTDNFKAHYMKQHGVSSYEADAYIRKWNDRGRP